MDEKRRYHRLPVEVSMRYRVPPEKFRTVTATLNISGTGLYFPTSYQLAVRQQMLVYLLLPGQGEVEMHGQVVRIDEPAEQPATGLEYGVAVKIMDPIKFDERKYIRYYADQLQGEFGYPAHA